MFRGLTPTFAREMPGYFCFFGGYELCRHFLTPAGKTKDEIGINIINFKPENEQINYNLKKKLTLRCLTNDHLRWSRWDCSVGCYFPV